MTEPAPNRPPRWSTPRNPDRATFGPLDTEVARLLGWQLFPWQQHVANVAGEHDLETKIPRYRTVGVSVARQNGKTSLVLTRIARQLIPANQTVAYTAQDRTVARTKWQEHVDLLMSTPFADRVARVDLTNHREMLVMRNGSRYLPVTPTTKKAARSMSIDLAVLDEAYAHDSMAVIGAISPTMTTRPAAQMWLLSNAGDKTSALWRHYTDLGRAQTRNPTSTICWFEYGADPTADPEDPEAWADGNPSLGYRGGATHVALAAAAESMDRDQFLREHLNVWADDESAGAIDRVAWAACKSPITIGDRVAFALEFSPDRGHGSLVAAGSVGSRQPIEVIDTSADLDHLVARAAEVTTRWEGSIVIDRTSPAGSAINGLKRSTEYTVRGKTLDRVKAVSRTDLVHAAGDFHDAAIDGQLAHASDPRLNAAVEAAARRKVGDAWTWQRRTTGADITPLVAATLARWGVMTAPPPTPPAVAEVARPRGRRLAEQRIGR